VSTLDAIVPPELLRRATPWLAALPLFGLLTSAIFGNGGLFELRRVRRERDVLSEEVFRVLNANETLRAQIRALRTSDRLRERLARLELGLVREGEIVYRFRSGKPDGSTLPLVR